MAIDRVCRFYNLICDECGEPHSEPFETFDDAKRGAPALGWETKRDEYGDWVNICPECQTHSI